MTISRIEAFDFSEFSYSNIGAELPNSYTNAGWQELDLSSFSFNDGYYGRAFVKVVGGVPTELVVSHRGTQFNTLPDIITDTTLAIGIPSHQIDDAINLKNAAILEFNNVFYDVLQWSGGTPKRISF